MFKNVIDGKHAFAPVEKGWMRVISVNPVTGKYDVSDIPPGSYVLLSILSMLLGAYKLDDARNAMVKRKKKGGEK